MAVFLRAARRRQLLVLARTHRCNVCSAASAWLKLGRDVGRLAQHCYIKRRRNAPRRFPFNSSASRPSRACLGKRSHSCFERRMACEKTGARRFGKTPPAGRAIGSGSCGAVAWAADPGPAPTPHTTNKKQATGQVRSGLILSCLVIYRSRYRLALPLCLGLKRGRRGKAENLIIHGHRRRHGRLHALFFECFPYVCPEPVLVN